LNRPVFRRVAGMEAADLRVFDAVNCTIAMVSPMTQAD
jgi:hypothetical protein